MHGITFCCHTLAASEYGGFCLAYLNELKKKIFQGKQNLKGAIDKTREINEIGLKKNEIAKASKRRTSRASNSPLFSENPLQRLHSELPQCPTLSQLWSVIMIINSSHVSWIPK